jgi:hypothetical protein
MIEHDLVSPPGLSPDGSDSPEPPAVTDEVPHYREPQLFVVATGAELLQGWYHGNFDGSRYGLVKWV